MRQDSLHYWVVESLKEPWGASLHKQMQSENCVVCTAPQRCPASFPFTHCKLPTHVRLSGRLWHSATRFSNQRFKLTLFFDTLLVEMGKENVRSYRNAGRFLSCFSQRPENLILTEGENKLKGFCFLDCARSDTVQTSSVVRIHCNPRGLQPAHTDDWGVDRLTSPVTRQKLQAGHPYFILSLQAHKRACQSCPSPTSFTDNSNRPRILREIVYVTSS